MTAANREVFANNAADTLSAAITSTSATTLTVNSASSFPSTGSFRVLVDTELMLVTGISGTTFTVVRGIEGTTAATHANSAPITHILTFGAIQRLGRDNHWDYDNGRQPFGLYDATGAPLASADFTAFNSASFADQAKNIVLTIPLQLSAVNNVLGGYRSLTPPYTVVAAFRPATVNDNNSEPFGGIGWTDGTGLVLAVLGITSNSTANSTAALSPPVIGVQGWGSATAFAGWQSGIRRFVLSDPIWWRLTDDNTNLTVEVSHDGFNWIVLWQDSRTAFLGSGPSHVGFFGNSYDNLAYVSYLSLVGWQEG